MMCGNVDLPEELMDLYREHFWQYFVRLKEEIPEAVTEYKDFPCVIEETWCLNKQVNMWSCHGSTSRPECYVNWVSTDPEDLEPYEDYVAEVTRAAA